MKDQGLRYNEDKTRWSLIPSEVIEALAEHYTRGAKKYEDNNWMKGLSYNDTYDCTMRHIHAWKMDEEYDEETGSRHLIAAIWNLVALVYFQMHRDVYAKFDDRVPNLSNMWAVEPGFLERRAFTNSMPIDRRINDIGRALYKNRRIAASDRRGCTMGHPYQSTKIKTDLTGEKNDTRKI